MKYCLCLIVGLVFAASAVAAPQAEVCRPQKPSNPDLDIPAQPVAPPYVDVKVNRAGGVNVELIASLVAALVGGGAGYVATKSDPDAGADEDQETQA